MPANWVRAIVEFCFKFKLESVFLSSTPTIFSICSTIHTPFNSYHAIIRPLWYCAGIVQVELFLNYLKQIADSFRFSDGTISAREWAHFTRIGRGNWLNFICLVTNLNTIQPTPILSIFVQPFEQSVSLYSNTWRAYLTNLIFRVVFQR